MKYQVHGVEVLFSPSREGLGIHGGTWSIPSKGIVFIVQIYPSATDIFDAIVAFLDGKCERGCLLLDDGRTARFYDYGGIRLQENIA